MIALWLLACTDTGTVDTDSGTDSGPPATVALTGVVFQFGTRDPLADAAVTVAEDPELATSSDAEGRWTLEVPAGATVTLHLSVPDHVQAHGETWQADADLDRLYLQAIPDALYGAIEAGLNDVGVFSDPAACQIVTTATVPEVQDLADFAAFQDYHPYGLAGATASLDGEALGPIYLDVGTVPDATLTSTTVDGGVMWLNAVAGQVYTLTGQHPSGHGFRSPRVTCEAGRFINANPPHGLGTTAP